MTRKDNYETKILVLDDERLIRMTMCARLKKAGYTAVAASSVDEAVPILKQHHASFCAIISDIMMGNMDGFAFRDIVHGIDPTMPFFFLTALDPEEGSGFLKRIVSDPLSYYLPKSVATDVLINRVKRVVASRKIEQFIERKMDEDRQSMALAEHIQRSLLPPRAIMTPRGFYSTFWKPMDIVSGDLYEAFQFVPNTYLYVLGDIQGHGTSAALAMTAVQSYIKRFKMASDNNKIEPFDIANQLQMFFRANLADVSYMTALICIHRPLENDILWISCGAPDLVIYDGGKKRMNINPEHRGGMPIGLMDGVTYHKEDQVRTVYSDTAVCMAYTDGILDLTRDVEGIDKMSDDMIDNFVAEMIIDARANGSLMPLPCKLMRMCNEYGFKHQHDDITVLMLGKTVVQDGIYEATVPLSPTDVDKASQNIGTWCRANGWSEELIGHVQLVVEEKMMNVYDHGFDDRDRMREVVSIRLMMERDGAHLTIWDRGSEEPSLAVAAGNAETAFELINKELSGHGRGRLIVRQLCSGIERNRLNELNETIYHIKKV